MAEDKTRDAMSAETQKTPQPLFAAWRFLPEVSVP
jgi:hypothetical protein